MVWNKNEFAEIMSVLNKIHNIVTDHSDRLADIEQRLDSLENSEPKEDNPTEVSELKSDLRNSHAFVQEMLVMVLSGQTITGKIAPENTTKNGKLTVAEYISKKNSEKSAVKLPG
jgi:hypothetical protein